MKNKGSRTKLVTEILSSIKGWIPKYCPLPMLSTLARYQIIGVAAPLYGYCCTLRGLRNDKELKTPGRISMAQASAGLIWTMSLFLVSCATFIAFALTVKRALTAEVILPALSFSIC